MLLHLGSESVRGRGAYLEQGATRNHVAVHAGSKAHLSFCVAFRLARSRFHPDIHLSLFGAFRSSVNFASVQLSVCPCSVSRFSAGLEKKLMLRP